MTDVARSTSKFPGALVAFITLLSEISIFQFQVCLIF